MGVTRLMRQCTAMLCERMGDRDNGASSSEPSTAAARLRCPATGMRACGGVRCGNPECSIMGGGGGQAVKQFPSKAGRGQGRWRAMKGWADGRQLARPAYQFCDLTTIQRSALQSLPYPGNS